MEKIKQSLSWFIAELKVGGWSMVIITIIITIMIILGACFIQVQERMEDIQWTELKQDSIIKDNKDSLSAFMSIIIESNATLVKNPAACRNLVLVSLKQPCYVVRKSVETLEWTEPSNKEILIWIPTDKSTWVWAEEGKDLKNAECLYIGDTYYNGDLQKITMKIVKKEDRGF